MTINRRKMLQWLALPPAALVAPNLAMKMKLNVTNSYRMVMKFAVDVHAKGKEFITTFTKID